MGPGLRPALIGAISSLYTVCMRAVVLLAFLAGATLAGQAPATPPQAPPQDSRPSFAEWLDEVRAEALTRGIRSEIVEEALGHIDEPVPVVIERDRAQA